jgi:hypothetical protein
MKIQKETRYFGTHPRFGAAGAGKTESFYGGKLDAGL